MMKRRFGEWMCLSPVSERSSAEANEANLEILESRMRAL